MDKVTKYWTGFIEKISEAHCPDALLFRTLGDVGFVIRGKRGLEIGYAANRGADSVEFMDRGASSIDLIDLIEVPLKESNHEFNIIRHKVGTAPLPVGGKYDFIFSKDTISYLSDQELVELFHELANLLTADSILLLQFCESLKESSAQQQAENLEILNFNRKVCHEDVFDPSNPLKLISAKLVTGAAAQSGLGVIASKIAAYSYGVDASYLRVDRYLCLQKI